MDVKGERGGNSVVDDFAHHPTAVRATIEAARGRWPKRRLWAILEPRSNSMRRKVFQESLPKALALADRVVAGRSLPRAAVGRRQPAGAGVRWRKSVRELGKDARAFEGADAIADYLAAEAKAGDLLLVMSNGSFDGLCDKLLKKIGSEVPACRGDAAGEIVLRSRRRAFGDGDSGLSVSVARWCSFPSTANAAIHYDVSLAIPNSILFHVTMNIPDVKGEVIVQMPAWNALYQIRDFSAHVQRVEAFRGVQESAPIEKLDKQTWRITRHGNDYDSLRDLLGRGRTVRYATERRARVHQSGDDFDVCPGAAIRGRATRYVRRAA